MTSTQVTAYLRAIGSKGGSATGPQKARTTEQARAAANKRWSKARTKKKSGAK